MNHPVLVKLRGDAEYIVLRTVAHGDNGRRSSFYITTGKLMRLEWETEIVVKDSSDFAVFRRDPEGNTVTISLYRVRECGDQSLIGWKQQFRLPYSKLYGFLESCADNRMTRETRMLSLPAPRGPRIVFEDTGNLHKAVSNKRIRKKLSKFLRSAFPWSGATEIRMYDDFIPYSFYFRELRGDTVGIQGGVILHGLNDLQTAYYSIHT